jgi:hypothetical protein
MFPLQSVYDSWQVLDLLLMFLIFQGFLGYCTLIIFLVSFFLTVVVAKRSRQQRYPRDQRLGPQRYGACSLSATLAQPTRSIP